MSTSVTARSFTIIAAIFVSLRSNNSIATWQQNKDSEKDIDSTIPRVIKPESVQLKAGVLLPVQLNDTDFRILK